MKYINIYRNKLTGRLCHGNMWDAKQDCVVSDSGCFTVELTAVPWHEDMPPSEKELEDILDKPWRYI